MGEPVEFPDVMDVGFQQMARFVRNWLDAHYSVAMFGDHRDLMYGDGSGVDTTAGNGPAAVRAYRLAVDLSAPTGEQSE